MMAKALAPARTPIGGTAPMAVRRAVQRARARPASKVANPGEAVPD